MSNIFIRWKKADFIIFKTGVQWFSTFSHLIIIFEFFFVSVFPDEVIGTRDENQKDGGADQTRDAKSKLDRRKKSTDEVFVLKKMKKTSWDCWNKIFVLKYHLTLKLNNNNICRTGDIQSIQPITPKVN